MNALRSFVMAFSTFSRIPMPKIDWRPECMRYMMCFFPLIGIVLGLLAWVWGLVCEGLSLGSLLFGAGLVAIPLLVTGGIHLDGFSDVVDAQSSHTEPARKREILKDPHTGAFAGMAVAAYLIVYFACAASPEPTLQLFVCLGCIYVLTRCLSGIASICFAGSSDEGMVASFRLSASKRVCVFVQTIEALACAVVTAVLGDGVVLAAMMVIALLVLALVHGFAHRQFGGWSGDIAGFFLQVCELALLLCLVVVPKVVNLI